MRSTVVYLVVLRHFQLFARCRRDRKAALDHVHLVVRVRRVRRVQYLRIRIRFFVRVRPHVPNLAQIPRAYQLRHAARERRIQFPVCLRRVIHRDRHRLRRDRKRSFHFRNSKLICYIIAARILDPVGINLVLAIQIGYIDDTLADLRGYLICITRGQSRHIYLAVVSRNRIPVIVLRQVARSNNHQALLRKVGIVGRVGCDILRCPRG